MDVVSGWGQIILVIRWNQVGGDSKVLGLITNSLTIRILGYRYRPARRRKSGYLGNSQWSICQRRGSGGNLATTIAPISSPRAV